MEEKLSKNQNNRSNIISNKLIDEIKYQLEKMLFSNKSILFFAEKSFLLIINDEYIAKSCIESARELFTRNVLNNFILEQKLENINLNGSNNVVNLDIDIINLEEIYISRNQIKQICPNLFDGFAKLKDIVFDNNQIIEIPSNLFTGLNNLKLIDFSGNRIKEIPQDSFAELVNLKNIYFNDNQIEEIHPNTFNGLVSLVSL